MPNNPNLYPQSTAQDWRFRSYHFAMDQGGANTNPLTAENVFIAAGPARLTQLGSNFFGSVFPIGMIESAMVNTQKMLQPLRELGSRRTYIIGGHSMGNISLSRVMYSHASLLRVLTIANGDSTDNNGQTDLDNPDGAFRYTAFNAAEGVAAETAKRQFSMNLQAEIFDRPIGLLFYFIDQRNQPYGAMYAEDCMIQNHGLSIAAQGIAMSEQVSMQFDRLNPVAVSQD